MIEADVDFPKVKKFLKLDDRFLRYRLSKKKILFFFEWLYLSNRALDFKKNFTFRKKTSKTTKKWKKIGKNLKGGRDIGKRKKCFKMAISQEPIDRFWNFFDFRKENIINYKKMPKNWEKSQRGPRYRQKKKMFGVVQAMTCTAWSRPKSRPTATLAKFCQLECLPKF